MKNLCILIIVYFTYSCSNDNVNSVEKESNKCSQCYFSDDNMKDSTNKKFSSVLNIHNGILLDDPDQYLNIYGKRVSESEENVLIKVIIDYNLNELKEKYKIMVVLEDIVVVSQDLEEEIYLNMPLEFIDENLNGHVSLFNDSTVYRFPSKLDFKFNQNGVEYYLLEFIEDEWNKVDFTACKKIH